MEITQEELTAICQRIPGDAAVYRVMDNALETVYRSPGLYERNAMSELEYKYRTQKNAADLIQPGDLPAVWQAIRQTLATGKELDCYYRVFHKTRGFDWLHAQGRLLGEMDGRPLLLVLFTNAATELNIFQMLLDRSSRFIYVCDWQTREILYANLAARRQGAFSSEGQAQRHCYECIRGRDAVCEDCFLTAVKAQGIVSQELYNERQERWEHISGERLRWCGHDAFVLYVEDVTQRRQLRNRIDTDERRYKLAVEGANLAVWEYDVREHRIVSYDKGLGKFGVPDVIENVPQSMLDHFDPQDVPKLIRMYQEIEAGADRVSGDFWARWHPGERPRCERIVYSVEKDDAGRPIRAYGLGQIITAQKQEEAKFRQSMQSLLSANPEARFTFPVNLTRDLCGEGHGRSAAILNPLQADTVDGLMTNISRGIRSSGDRQLFGAHFSRVNLLQEYAMGSSNLHMDFQQRDEDGKLIWVRMYARLLKNPETEDIEGILYSLDVSAEKRRNLIFRIITRQEYGFVALLHVESAQLEFLHLNEAFRPEYREIFGAVSGMLDVKLLHDQVAARQVVFEDRERYLADSRVEKIRQELDTQGHYEFVVRKYSLEKPVTVLYRKFQHYYLGDDRDTILVIGRDETAEYERQQKELEYARTEARRVRDILEHIPGGICVLNMPDEEHLQIAYANKQMYRLLHYPENENYASEVSDQTHPDVARYYRDGFSGLHPEDVEKTRRMFREGYHQDRFRVPAIRTLTGRGDYLWLSIEVELREARPEGRKFYAVYRDITEEMRLNQELTGQLEREKALTLAAVQANEAKSDFLSRMSHDIRTPLNGIIGMSHIASRQTDVERIRSCLAKIDTSSRFLLGLVNDILDMAKAESNKIELHPELYTPQDFQAYLDAIIRPLCEEKNQQLVLDIQLPLDYVPFIDKLRINQIYFNLLSNAVKYTPEGGSIACRAKAEVKPAAAGGFSMHLSSSISDSGIGMSEDFQKVLFEPFSQEGRSDVSESRGTGLGLAIVKRMLECMGGRITVDSQLGKGTTFTFQVAFDCVPLQAAVLSEQQHRFPPEDYARLAGRHILVCEDHPLNQEIAQAILEEKAMLVKVAENGERGVELFRTSPIGFYDAILMDIRMPVMNGYEAVAAIRQLPRSDAAGVPILAMTADAFADDVQKCREAGMDGHVAKPIDAEKLYDALLTAIQARAR